MQSEPLTASVYIDAPPERVYAFFTRPEALVTWMGDSALLEPIPDGRFEVDVKGARVRGHFLHLDPPNRLVISWGYAGSECLPPDASTVEVRLVTEGAGTRVNLQHGDLPTSERPGHDSGWRHYLTRLCLAVDGGAGRDPGMPTQMTDRQGRVFNRDE